MTEACSKHMALPEHDLLRQACCKQMLVTQVRVLVLHNARRPSLHQGSPVSLKACLQAHRLELPVMLQHDCC